MPSNKPRIATYTTQTNVDKLRVISAMNKKSMSDYLNYLIEKCIMEYEKEHGEIVINEEEPPRNALKAF